MSLQRRYHCLTKGIHCKSLQVHHTRATTSPPTLSQRPSLLSNRNGILTWRSYTTCHTQHLQGTNRNPLPNPHHLTISLTESAETRPTSPLQPSKDTQPNHHSQFEFTLIGFLSESTTTHHPRSDRTRSIVQRLARPALHSQHHRETTNSQSPLELHCQAPANTYQTNLASLLRSSPSQRHPKPADTSCEFHQVDRCPCKTRPSQQIVFVQVKTRELHCFLEIIAWLG